MAQYLLGLDNGGSTVKCGLYTATGAEVAVASASVEMQTPRPGFTERDTKAIWAANCAVVRSVLEKSGVGPGGVAAVSVTGYGNGINFIGADGNAVYPSIVSTDTRANEMIARWNSDGIAALVLQETNQRIYAAQPPALLRWFHENNPAVLEKTRWALSIKDYVRFRLTGQVHAELTDQSATCLMDIRKREYSDKVLKALGIDAYRSLLPDSILSPTAPAGYITRRAAMDTGLAEGTPVAAGLFDIDACCVSNGIRDEHTLCLVTGTWSINEYVTPNIEEGTGKFSTTNAYLPGHYLISDSSATSVSNFDWYLRSIMQYRYGMNYGPELLKKCDGVIAGRAPDESGVIFLPYLFASGSYPGDKGAFLNLGAWNDAEAMLQAVYEGVVFSSAYHVERLSARRAPFERGKLSGAVTKSPIWAQMMADILQIPLEVADIKEHGARGAAMCAGICAGLWEDYGDAADHLEDTVQTYRPNPSNAAVYAKKFNAYKKAVTAADSLHAALDDME